MDTRGSTLVEYFSAGRIDRYKLIMAMIYICLIIWSAVQPLSGKNWFLEMLPVFVFAPFILFLGARFTLSNFSYALIFIYMIMPVIQAHFGVGFVPSGFLLGELIGTERNMFDRATHLMFGLLWYYPLYEMVKKYIHSHRFLVYMIPAAVLMALGAVYEVAEWLVYEMSGPGLAFLFIGAQDDFYDTPKDLAMTLAGIVITFVILLIRNISSKKY